jgi:hypothetical protein
MKQKSPTGIRLNTMIDPRYMSPTAIKAEEIADDVVESIITGNYTLMKLQWREMVRKDRDMADMVWSAARLAACMGLKGHVKGAKRHARKHPAEDPQFQETRIGA